MLVRISQRGMNVLNNKDLAMKVIKSIINSKQNFDAGHSIKVEGVENISVKTVTSPIEHTKQEKDPEQ